MKHEDVDTCKQIKTRTKVQNLSRTDVVGTHERLFFLYHVSIHYHVCMHVSCVCMYTFMVAEEPCLDLRNNKVGGDRDEHNW
jgi:hypothetical protein